MNLVKEIYTHIDVFYKFNLSCLALMWPAIWLIQELALEMAMEAVLFGAGIAGGASVLMFVGLALMCVIETYGSYRAQKGYVGPFKELHKAI